MIVLISAHRQLTAQHEPHYEHTGYQYTTIQYIILMLIKASLLTVQFT